MIIEIKKEKTFKKVEHFLFSLHFSSKCDFIDNICIEYIGREYRYTTQKIGDQWLVVTR